jgi:hypothetical protein
MLPSKSTSATTVLLCLWWPEERDGEGGVFGAVLLVRRDRRCPTDWLERRDACPVLESSGPLAAALAALPLLTLGPADEEAWAFEERVWWLEEEEGLWWCWRWWGLCCRSYAALIVAVAAAARVESEEDAEDHCCGGSVVPGCRRAVASAWSMVAL